LSINCVIIWLNELMLQITMIIIILLDFTVNDVIFISRN